MGILRKFACPYCEGAWEVKLGQGIRHAMLESVLREFPEEMHPAILASAGGSPMPIFDFQYQAARCARCGEIISVPVITIGGNVHAAPCPHCGDAAKVLDEEETPLCPRCGRGRIASQRVGHWD